MDFNSGSTIKKDILCYWITFIMTCDFAADPSAFSYLGELNLTMHEQWRLNLKRLNSVTYATTSLCHLDSNSAFWFSNIPVNSPPSIFVAAWEKREEGGLPEWCRGKYTEESSFQKEIRVYLMLLFSKIFIFTVSPFGKVRIEKNCSEERSNLKAILWVIYCFMVFQPVEVEGWECFFFVSSFLNCLTGSSLQRMGFL